MARAPAGRACREGGPLTPSSSSPRSRWALKARAPPGRGRHDHPSDRNHDGPDRRHRGGQGERGLRPSQGVSYPPRRRGGSRRAASGARADARPARSDRPQLHGDRRARASERPGAVLAKPAERSDSETPLPLVMASADVAVAQVLSRGEHRPKCRSASPAIGAPATTGPFVSGPGTSPRTTEPTRHWCGRATARPRPAKACARLASAAQGA